jgi:hypothetical protein
MKESSLKIQLVSIWEIKKCFSDSKKIITAEVDPVEVCF